MKKRNDSVIYICAILITILILTMLSVYASASYKESESTRLNKGISAKAAAIYEPEGKVFIYEKCADQRLPMASTTKIMTAIVVEDLLDLDEIVTIGPESVGVEGSSAYLREGDEYTILELLYAMMLQSANDAATALAYYTAGGIDEFAELMNGKAEALGLTNTHFTNPHGLDDEDHYTTARDLAVMGAKLLESETLKEIVSTYKKSFTYGERTRTYVNHNKLLRLYDGAIGIKTGFTKRCGRCLVGAAERDGIKFVSVTLDAPSDWSDHEAMLDFAFDSYEKTMLCKKGDYNQALRVIGGNKDSLTVSAKESLEIIKEKEAKIIDRYTSLPGYVVAPINEGDVVGKVVFRLENKTYTVDLTADESIDSTLNDSIFTRLLKKILR